MKYFIVLALIALAGCVEETFTPSPAMQGLMSACDKGDIASCKNVADLEQRERERRSSIPVPVFTSSVLDPADFQNNRQAPAPIPLSQQVTCRPTYGGKMICNNY